MPRTGRRSVIVLLSGGLDSCVLLHWCAERFTRVYPLYVEAGLRWERAEQYWVRKYLEAYRRKHRGARIQPLTIVSALVPRDAMPAWSRSRARAPGRRSADAAVFLPGRNVALLAGGGVAAALQGASAVAIGTLSANPFPDGRPVFFRRMAAALSSGIGRPVRVLAPFRAWAKERVFHYGASLPLHLSFSCIAPGWLRGVPIPCANCNKCEERARALRAIHGAGG